MDLPPKWKSLSTAMKSKTDFAIQSKIDPDDEYLFVWIELFTLHKIIDSKMK